MIYMYIIFKKTFLKKKHKRDVLFVTTFETFFFYMKRKQNVHYHICKDVNRKARSLEREKGIIY